MRAPLSLTIRKIPTRARAGGPQLRRRGWRPSSACADGVGAGSRARALGESFCEKGRVGARWSLFSAPARKWRKQASQRKRGELFGRPKSLGVLWCSCRVFSLDWPAPPPPLAGCCHCHCNWRRRFYRLQPVGRGSRANFSEQRRAKSLHFLKRPCIFRVGQSSFSRRSARIEALASRARPRAAQNITKIQSGREESLAGGA